MDKQLIEKIALEVVTTLPALDTAEAEWCEFAHRFLARIDAERGKDAVMFAVKRDSGAGGECDVDNPNKVPVSPSPTPTIPEGMALVNAKKLNEFRNALETGLAWVVIPEGNCSCHLRPPCNNCIERSSAENDEQEIIGACKQIASILAAAQGERK